MRYVIQRDDSSRISKRFPAFSAPDNAQYFGGNRGEDDGGELVKSI